MGLFDIIFDTVGLCLSRDTVGHGKGCNTVGSSFRCLAVYMILAMYDIVRDMAIFVKQSQNQVFHFLCNVYLVQRKMCQWSASYVRRHPVVVHNFKDFGSLSKAS